MHLDFKIEDLFHLSNLAVYKTDMKLFKVNHSCDLLVDSSKVKENWSVLSFMGKFVIFGDNFIL